MTTLFLHQKRSLFQIVTTVALGTSLIAPFTKTASAVSFLSTGTTYGENLESERIVCADPRGVGSLSLVDCHAVARDFYRELRFQITDFTGASLTVIRPTSFMMAPDGSGFAKGIEQAFPLFLGLTSFHPFALSIENKFSYQVIDKDTVVFFGAPLFTNFDGVDPAHPVFIDNLQMSIYRRINGTLNDPSCRSVQNPTGNTCWAIMTELWTYKAPVGSGVTTTPVWQEPTPQPNTFLRTSGFPATLEAQRIVCDSQSADATSTDAVWNQKCPAVAREFYDQFRLDPSNYTGAGRLDTPASVVMSPDGSGYVGGVLASELYASITNNKSTVHVENAFTYKPIDDHTVIVQGAPLVTLTGQGSEDLSYVRNAQLSVYRRTLQGLHAPDTCRSSSKPLGNDCWVLATKLWTYQQPMGAGVSVTPPSM